MRVTQPRGGSVPHSFPEFHEVDPQGVQISQSRGSDAPDRSTVRKPQQVGEDRGIPRVRHRAGQHRDQKAVAGVGQIVEVLAVDPHSTCQLPRRVVAHQLDVDQVVGPRAQTVHEGRGVERVEVRVDRFGSLEQFSPGQIRRLIDLNLTSQILLARTFLPLLKKQGHGNLVFIGSEAALSGGRKGAVYSASKFALRGFAQSLREECAASGVRVGMVNPGMVATGFFRELDFRPGGSPDQHLQPRDVADAVWLMLTARPGAVIDEINLSPQKKVIEFGKSD